MPEPLRSAASGWRVPAIALVVAVVVGGLGILRVWPPFAVVMSGSMAPTINTGDMVVLEKLHAPARVGQIVAVDVPDGARARYGYPPVVIHRVFRITPDGQLRTKGDARPQPDPFTVPRTAVDTRVVAHIPSAGRVLAFFHSAPGLLWLAFGGLLFFGLPVLERQREARRHEAEATADLHEELTAVTGEIARLHAEQERNRAAADATLSQLDRLTQLVELAFNGAAVAPPAGMVSAPAAEPAAVASGSDDDLAAPPLPALTAATAGLDAAETEPAAAEVASHVAPPAIPPAEAMAPRAVSPATPTPVVVEPAVARALPAAPPATGTALVLVAPAQTPRSPAAIGRWDELPCAPARPASGWAAPPPPPPTRRFSRRGGLVAASHA